METNTRKSAIIAALHKFVAQRPGLEYCNYGDAAIYRSEMRSITADRHHAETLLTAVSWRDSITADDLIKAAEHAFSGRLSIKEIDGKVRLEYCTGQYFPTEYRKAVCAVLASALWDYARANMPAPSGKVKRVSGVGAFRTESEHDSINGLSPGDWLRKHFRSEFGRSIGNRWFN